MTSTDFTYKTDEPDHYHLVSKPSFVEKSLKTSANICQTVKDNVTNVLSYTSTLVIQVPDGIDAVPKKRPTEVSDAVPTDFSANYLRRFASLPDFKPTFTARDSQFYNLWDGQRLALILNYSEFLPGRDVPPRTGTNRDIEAIRRTFASMDFYVCECNNYTVSQIEEKLCDIQEMKDLSCLALFILTHGEENGILYAYDSNIRLDKHIIHRLLPEECPSLAGKPKLIFVQACQGDSVDEGADLAYRFGRNRSVSMTSADGSGSAMALTYRIPAFSDFLIYQASYHGHYSFRSGSGSWFVQALCKELNASKDDEELMSILTRVSRSVALDKSSNAPHVPELHDKKQVPLRQDTLLREVYLKMKYPPCCSLKKYSNTATSQLSLKKRSNCCIT